MSLSDDLRDELAQIAPARRCCCLAELSALFHASGAWHLRGGTVAVHLDLVSSAIARRAFALLRDLGVRSEIRTYSRRAFDRATRYQLHVEVDERALDVLREAGVLSPSGAPLGSAAEARRRPLVLPRRLPARRPPRGGLAVRARAIRTSSCARAGIEGARFIAEVAAGEDVQLKVAERRTHAVAYAKGHETIADVLALAGAGDTALRLDEHAVLAALRADANRLANADEANLVRSAASRPRAGRGDQRRRSSTRCRRARRDRRAAPAPPVRLAARARGEGAPADHEGGGPPPPAVLRRLAECGFTRGTN